MDIWKQAAQIQPVSAEASKEYESKQSELTGEVDRVMASRSDIHRILGNNPLQVMYDNHRYHAMTMSNFFKMNRYTLLARIIVWVYRAYRSRGFEYEYFYHANQAWQNAIQNHLPLPAREEILAVYRWLNKQHQSFVELAESQEYRVFSETANDSDMYGFFLTQLLQGDYKQCLALSEHFMAEQRTMGDFYTHVIQPCQYEVGRLWETGHVSIAHEHLATAIVSRVMLRVAANSLRPNSRNGRAVITCAPNELHEIGARMVADLLEEADWDVHYLGANVPDDELVQYVRAVRPEFVGISAVMPFNLHAIKTIIQRIHAQDEIGKGKVMVGGLAFQHDPELWEFLGADGYAPDARTAVQLANEWREAGK